VISDIHGTSTVLKWVPRVAKSCDALLILGDVTNWGEAVIFRHFLNHLTGVIPSIYLVPGNHDPQGFTTPPIESLHAQVKMIGGFPVAGLGGSNPTPFNTPFELSDDAALALLQSFPPNLAILASHAPPFGTACDLASDRSHIGSRPVRKFIEEKRPRLTVSGHVHESRGTDSLNGCPVANVGPASQGFYAVITLGSSPQIQLEQMQQI